MSESFCENIKQNLQYNNNYIWQRYLLQVLLNFEGLKLCCDVVEADAVSSTANRV